MSVDIVGETAVCSIEVKTAAGTYVSPSTSMKITIRAPDGKIVVDGVAMTNTGGVTGYYHYDYTATAGKGKYKVLYVAVNGTRTSKAKDDFTIVSESD